MSSATPLAAAFRSTKPALLAAFALSIFINLTLFAAPLYSLQVYDRVLGSRSLATLAALTVIVGCFIVLYGTLEFARSGVLVRGGNRFHQALARPVFDLAMRASNAGRPAQATLCLKDLEALRDALSSTAVSALLDVPWTPVFVGLCFLFHPAMGLVALTGAILILCCALATEVGTRHKAKAAVAASAEAGRFASAGLRQVEAVIGLGMSGTVAGRWVGLQNAALAAQSNAGERSALLLATTKVVRLGVQIALIGVGAWLAIDRLISPGVMMAAMIIMGRALAPVEHAVANWRRMTAARDAARRLEELFQQLPAPGEATMLPEPTGKVDVEGLVLKPPRGGEATIKDVSFSLAAGTALAIVGPSGSGKSSLVKALAGAWQPARGTVRLDGAALQQWNDRQLGQALGYLPQDVELFTGTVAENIARMGAADDGIVVRAARAAGVHEAILKLPQGYQTMLGDGGTVLSGGMRQRIGLARALHGEPCLVILDEPNSSLDSEGEAALAECIAGLRARKCTVVVVTHRPQLLASVDSILVIRDGRLQRFGARSEVLTQLQERSKVATMRPQRAAGQSRSAQPAA